MDGVGGFERDELGIVRPAGHGFVAFAGRAGGVGVLERRKVVDALPLPDDVVRGRALVFEEAEFGLGPVDAVDAERVADALAAAGIGLEVEVRAAVVHAEEAVVFKDGEIARSIALPRGIDGDRHVALDGFVEDLLNAVHGLDEELVPEGFEAGADIYWLRGACVVAGQQQQNGQRGHCGVSVKRSGGIRGHERTPCDRVVDAARSRAAACPGRSIDEREREMHPHWKITGQTPGLPRGGQQPLSDLCDLYAV